MILYGAHNELLQHCCDYLTPETQDILDLAYLSVGKTVQIVIRTWQLTSTRMKADACSELLA